MLDKTSRHKEKPAFTTVIGPPECFSPTLLARLPLRTRRSFCPTTYEMRHAAVSVLLHTPSMIA